MLIMPNSPKFLNDGIRSVSRRREKEHRARSTFSFEEHSPLLPHRIYIRNSTAAPLLLRLTLTLGKRLLVSGGDDGE